MVRSIGKASALLFAFAVCLPLAAHAQVTGYAVVPNIDGTLSMIRTDSASVYLTPTVGNTPSCVAITPDGRRGYVATNSDVTVFDMDSGNVITHLAVGSGAFCVAVTPDGKKVYFDDAVANTVTPIDVATNTLGTAIAVGPSPLGLAIAPDGGHLYAVNSGTSVSVIDTTTDMVVATIPLGAAIGAATIAISPDGHWGYVPNQANNPFAAVYVLDLTTNTVDGVPITPGQGAYEGVVSPDGATLYVPNGIDGNVSVIDTATRTVTATIPMSAEPQAIGITRDGTTLYVTAPNAHQVLRIDRSTNTELSPAIGTGTGSSSANNAFMSPMYIAQGPPLTIASDADLTGLGFGADYVAFFGGGVLKLAGDWTTNRAISLLQSGGSLDTSGFTATLAHGMVGDGGLTKTGNGTLFIPAGVIASQAGATNVQGGAVQVDGQHPAGFFMNGGTVSGTGTIGDVIANSGFIKPGTATTPGTLTAGHVTMSGLELNLRLNGTTSGSYDSLHATTATLDHGQLSVTLGYTTVPGDRFTVVTNTTGTFESMPEGTIFTTANAYLRLTYQGGASGHDAVLIVDGPPTITSFTPQTLVGGQSTTPIPFTIGDDFVDPSALTVTVTSSNPGLVQPTNISINGSGAARTLQLTTERGVSGTSQITVTVFDGHQSASVALPITVNVPTLTYFLTEGATGSFFATDIAIANPNNQQTPITLTFYKEDGTTSLWNYIMDPLSRVTFGVDQFPGMESTSFATAVASNLGVPLGVERTMWWDKTGYGAHGEKASAGPAAQWYFAEGSQGFFHTYFLLLNQNPTANIAHVTYYLEDGSPLLKDYPLAPTSRTTIDIALEPVLQNRSFGALITFDQPGMAERAMYFGDSPLFSGGHDSSGANAPSTTWFLAEGATGTFFDTFILIANPNDGPATVTTTYLPASGSPVPKTHVVDAHQRLTINIATEDPTLESAAVATSIGSDVPVIAERSQYWPHGNWYEAHNSAGETSAGTKWILAEGRVGGDNHAQSYILLANAGDQPAVVTATFLRTFGAAPVVKTFTVQPTSRLNVSVTGAGSDVPELADESFGVQLTSTQPIIVERSMYTDANGVIWAAGTNATAARMP